MHPATDERELLREREGAGFLIRFFRVTSITPWRETSYRVTFRPTAQQWWEAKSFTTYAAAQQYYHLKAHNLREETW